jgi:hypothetical protein
MHICNVLYAILYSREERALAHTYLGIHAALYKGPSCPVDLVSRTRVRGKAAGVEYDP